MIHMGSASVNLKPAMVLERVTALLNTTFQEYIKINAD